MKSKYYAGIGSRQTPSGILLKMQDLGVRLGRMGYVLRSGGADGADTAFEEGCDKYRCAKEIWLPWAGFNNRQETVPFTPDPVHFEHASKIHPAWQYLKPSVQRLHARNSGQVLGKDCSTPSEFVLCWTPDGCEHADQRSSKTGGTGQAIALASKHNVPVINLANPNWKERLETLLKPPMNPYNNLPHANNAYYSGIYNEIHRDLIFVFGSNKAGRHGKGAAKEAIMRYGASYGVGEGLVGRSYAIPTKDALLQPLPLEQIKEHVRQFVELTKQDNLKTFVTPVGTGLAFYESYDIAPMFEGICNAWLPLKWKPYLATPDRFEDGQVKGFFEEYRWLSNFWTTPVHFKGKIFPSVENAYQYEKMEAPNEELLKVLLKVPASVAKKLGKQGKMRSDWESIKVDVMMTLLRCKFQNPKMCAKLLLTGDTHLAEQNTWNDLYWGTNSSGKGNNWLGKLLMQIRAELLESTPTNLVV